MSKGGMLNSHYTLELGLLSTRVTHCITALDESHAILQSKGSRNTIKPCIVGTSVQLLS